jgi:hypothetical protein
MYTQVLCVCRLIKGFKMNKDFKYFFFINKKHMNWEIRYKLIEDTLLGVNCSTYV